jgi:PAS domain S-box-containing protein
MKPSRAGPAHAIAGLRWLPLWILAVGLALTAGLGLWSFQREAQQRGIVLEREARDLGTALQHQVQAYIDTLPGLRVFGVLRQAPTDAEFQHYVQALSLQDRYPGLAITFLAELVGESERPAFEARGRQDRSVSPEGHPGFRIVPPGSRPDYLVLRHLYPDDPPAFGYDLFDPAQGYRPDADRAIGSGNYVATGPLQLARDRGKPPDPALVSVVVRAALYQGGATPATPELRRQLAVGVAGIGFRIQPLVAAVLPPRLANDLRVRIVDEQVASSGAAGLLFDSLPEGRHSMDSLVFRGHVAVADRSWTITAHRRNSLAGQDSTWILLVFGAGLSLALAAMTRALVLANGMAEARLRETADALVNERDQLRQTEARFRMLFEHSFDAVLSTRPDGIVLAANAAACALFGAPEAVLKTLSRDHLVDPTDERLVPMLEERRRTGRAAGALRMRRADGTVFDAEVSSNVYVDSDGRLSTSMIVRDVTDRQRLAQRLQEKQRLEAIGTLAGGVAHDFNNMLAAILGNVALAEQEISPGSPALGRLQLVHRAADRARSLVRQILTFSRRAPNQRVVQPLQPLVDEAIALLRSTLPPSVRLEVGGAAPRLWARVDGAQVQQMVLNLCTNAWQALPEAHGEVRVSLTVAMLTPDEAVALGLPAGGEHACLRVSDDGQGMTDDVRLRIFEPFFTTKPVGQGTGLGLAVVHGVVTESAGAIRVESEPGRGTVFTVYLPVVPAPSDDVPSEPGALPPHNDGHGERILYVDDDEVVALTASALLQNAGYTVTCAADARAALDILRDSPVVYTVLVTDFNMPGMSGLALAEAVRAEHPRMRIIVTSGLVTEELQRRAIALGIGDVLFKEDMLERLVDAVRRLLRRRAGRG